MKNHTRSTALNSHGRRLLQEKGRWGWVKVEGRGGGEGRRGLKLVLLAPEPSVSTFTRGVHLVMQPRRRIPKNPVKHFRNGFKTSKRTTSYLNTSIKYLKIHQCTSKERVRNSRGKRAIMLEPLKLYCILLINI